MREGVSHQVPGFVPCWGVEDGHRPGCVVIESLICGSVFYHVAVLRWDELFAVKVLLPCDVCLFLVSILSCFDPWTAGVGHVGLRIIF